MKKYIKNSLVIVVLFTTLLSNANETFILRNLSDNKTTTLTLLDVKQGNQLLIKDVDGFVLYKEKIQNSGIFTKGFNLTTLPDGAYYFEYINDLEYKKIPFKIINSRLKNSKDQESPIVKVLNKSKKKQKTNKTENPIKQEKGSENRVLNFKGAYFNKYYNSNN